MQCPLCSAQCSEESVKCGACNQILPTWIRAKARADKLASAQTPDAPAPRVSSAGLGHLARYSFFAVLIGSGFVLFQNCGSNGATASTGAAGGVANGVTASTGAVGGVENGVTGYFARLHGSVNMVEAVRDQANAHTSEMELELERTGEYAPPPPDKAVPAPPEPPRGFFSPLTSIWSKAQSARQATDAQTDKQVQELKAADGDPPRP